MVTLTFSGELVTGYRREQVVENLAALLKQPPEKVSQRLFSGKTVVIKRDVSVETADKWRQAFARAGAVLVVTDTDEPDTGPHYQRVVTEEPSPSSLAAQGPSVRQRNRGYLWLGLIAVVLIVVIVLALWLTRPLWQSPELQQDQRDLVSALAMADTTLLGHVDIERIRSLESLAGTETDVESLPATEGFWASMLDAGLDPRRDVDHLWLAGYYSGEKPGLVGVASGRFDQERLEQWLGERYSLQGRDGDGILFSRLDPNTCELLAPQIAFVESDRLWVGDPERVKALRQRLQSGAAAEVDLARWHAVSSEQIASLAVLVPGDMGRGVSGIAGMMVQGLGAAASPAQGLYLGMNTVALPPGVELSVLVASDDPAFTDKVHSSTQQWVNEARAKAQQSWPEMADFYDHLSVQKNDRGVRAAIRFDQHFKRDLSRWMSSLVGGMFSGMGGEPGDPGEERIDTNAPQYRDLAAGNLPVYSDFSQIPQHFFKTTHEAGPFGLGVKSLQLREDGGLDITLGARAYNLENLPSRGSAAQLVVDAVENESGESLLPSIPCGPDSYREPGDIGNVIKNTYFVDGEQHPYVEISGEKTLSLPAEVTLSDIERLRGHIEYRQTLAVEHHVLPMPVAGEVVEGQGVQVRFMGGDEYSLRYQVSSDSDRLLHIYARNAAGEPLSSGSSMGGGSLWGSGKSWTVDYNGTIASVEVVLAREQEVHRFPFQLNRLQPPPSESIHSQPSPSLVDPEQWERLRQAAPPEVTYDWQEPAYEVDAGPLRLAVTEVDFDQHFGLIFNADVYVSNRFDLVGSLGAGELHLSQVESPDGTNHSLDMTRFFAFARDGGYWMNGVYQPDEEKPWHKGSVSLRDRNNEITEAEAVNGYVALVAVSRTRDYDLPFSFGVTWRNDNLRLQVSKWEVGKIHLTWEGDMSRLVTIQAYNGDQLISQPARIEQMFGDATIALEVTDVPTHLIIQMAEEYERQAFDFSLDL